MTQATAATAHRILVVCLGNHCRSPLAAAILTRRGGDAVDVRSAGLTGHHIGRPAHQMMITAARQLGYDLTGHRGVELTADLLAWADVVLTMDLTVHGQLQQRDEPNARPVIRLYLRGANIPDPWGKTAADFVACAALIEAGADQHLP